MIVNYAEKKFNPHEFLLIFQLTNQLKCPKSCNQKKKKKQILTNLSNKSTVSTSFLGQNALAS